MMSMQSRTKKSTLALLCCLALAGLASCSGGGGGGGRDPDPRMEIYPPMTRVAIPDQTVTVGGTETLDMGRYFTDRNGDPLTYSAASRDASVATATVSGSVVTIRGLAAGAATMRVTARDPGGLTAQQDFEVQVQAAIPRDTPPNLAEAIDITGRRSVEGRLDSPGDSLVYRLQIDEPGIVSFEISGEADAEITLYDSNGNVLARGVPGTLPDGQAIPRTAPVPEVRAVPLVAVFAVVAVRTAIPIFARVALRKATGAAVRTGAFALRHAKTAFAVTRVLTKKLEFDVKYSSLLDSAQSFEVHDHFDGETSVEHEWNITPSVRIPRWGLAVKLKVDSTGTVRMSRGSGSVMCGSGTKYDQTIETTLTLTWRQTTIVELPSKVQFNFLRDTAPRRKGSEAISVTVPEGGSGTVLLTDYIEDPKGRSLTFTPGDPVPDGLSVTRNGARWTIAAKEGVTGGTIIVTAATGTGRARECWNFPLRVNVGSQIMPKLPPGLGDDTDTCTTLPSTLRPWCEACSPLTNSNLVSCGRMIESICRNFPSADTTAFGIDYCMNIR